MKEFIVMMASMMSLVAISIDATLPALGVIGVDLNVSNPNHSQYVIVFMFFGLTIGQLISGPLSDAIGRKRILYIGLAIYVVGCLISYGAQDLTTMLIGRFVQGLGVSGPYISAVAIVRDKYTGRDMARIMSLVMVIFILVPAIAPSLGQAILYFSSWHSIFAFYIVYGLAVLTWISIRLEETLPPEKRIPFSIKNLKHGFIEIVSSRATVCYTVCMGVCFGGLIGYLNSSQQIFQDQFKVGEMFSVYFGVLALVLGVASLVNSRFVQQLGMRHIAKRAIIGMIAVSTLFLAVNLLVPEVKLWMFLGYTAVIFFCFGLMFGNFNAMAMEKMGHIAGIASAIIGATSSAMSMVLGATIGQLYNGTLVPMTLGFFTLGIIALVMMMTAEGRKFESE